MSASRLTAAQLADAIARRRDGRPDITVMSNEERRQAGLMDRHQAAEHELLRSLPHPHPAERVHGPVPGDPWASGHLWAIVRDAGHLGCGGWTVDSRDGLLVCSCGCLLARTDEAAS